MTTGTVLLLAGSIGLAVFALAGILSWVLLRKKRKKLLHAIEQEYQ